MHYLAQPGPWCWISSRISPDIVACAVHAHHHHYHGASGLSPWLVALIGAVVGGVLAFGGGLGLQARQSRTNYAELRNLLLVELRSILHEATNWSAPDVGADAALRLPPSLPTAAWSAISASPDGRHLKRDERLALYNLYRDVASANYQASLVPMMLQISSSARSDEARFRYREEAHRLASEPFEKLIQHHGDFIGQEVGDSEA